MTNPDRPLRHPLAALLLIAAATLLAAPALAQAPAAAWEHRFGSDDNENVFDVAVDDEGTAYLVGATQGDFERPTEGFFDAFVHAVDPQGEAAWTAQLHFGDFDVLTTVDIAPNGDVIVAGYAGGEIAGPPAGGDDAFAMRFTADGTELWRAAFGTPGRDQAFALAIDDGGVIYLGGTSDGGLVGDAAGEDDAFLIALEPDGSERWRDAMATPAQERSYAAAARPGGGVVVAPSSQGALDAPNEGGFDVYLRAYDATGSIEARASLHDAADLRAYGLTVAPDGTWIVVGGGPEGPDDGADVPVFVRSVHPDGETLWSASLGPARRDLGHGVAVAPDGTIVVAAATEADVVGSNAGVADALMAGLSPDGAVVWREQFGSERFDKASAVAAGPDGVWVAGSAQGPLPGGVADDGFDGDGWLRHYPF